MKTLKKSLLILVILSLIIIFSNIALASDNIVINSQNWEDVYSGMLYGNLQGIPNNFLTGTRAGVLVLNSIPKNGEVEVLSSRSEPYVVGYEAVIKSRGFTSVDETRYRTMNLDLAEKLENITKFIVIDPSYGYNALSAGPYAVATNSYVLFADSRNIGSIENFLSDRQIDSLLLFGQLDRDVKTALEQYNPEILNLGDRFDNNLALVDKYLEVNPSKQVILTNGEFLEASMMTGENPVVFTGKTNVPDVIREYIQNSDIEVGVLIGNELVGVATFIRRQLGISVFVKFAQGARQPEGAISQVEDLDRFPMPKYVFGLEIQSVVFNKATRSLEITYKNPVEQAIFFKSSISIQDGTELKITGDEDPIFIDGNTYKTIIYKYDVDGQELNLLGEDLEAVFFTIFGESPKSMEYTLEGNFKIESVEVLDDSNIDILDLYYDKGKGQFFVEIQNTGTVDVYVNAELIDLLINGEEVMVAADEVIKISKGAKVKIPITIEMVEEDFADNPEIKVRAYYGEREISLIKMKEATFAFRLQSTNYVTYALIAVVLLLIFFFLGTKKKCKKCGHKNARGRKTCEKCGHKF